MMTSDEIIAVVQAYKEGKRIQQAPAHHCIPANFFELAWKDWDELAHVWNFEVYQYRVSPEPRKPREWVINKETGHAIPITGCMLKVGNEPYIHVREVIE